MKPHREFWLFEEEMPGCGYGKWQDEPPNSFYKTTTVIPKEDYESLLAQAEKLEKALFSIKKHTLHPDNKPSVWNDYLQDLADEALENFLKWKAGK